MTEPTFHQRVGAMMDAATTDDTLAVASANGASLVLQTRIGRAADLVQIARSLLDQASDAIEREGGRGAARLARQVAEALECLPDPHTDDDGDG